MIPPPRRFAPMLKPGWIATPAALALLAGGCVGVPHDRPGQHMTSADDLGLKASKAQAAPTPVAADWWRAMGDGQLNAIEADALAHNPSLAEVETRLNIAQAAVHVAQAARLPQVSSDTSLQRQRFSANSIYPPPFGGAEYWVSNAEVDVSWSLDLAGRQKAIIAAAQAGAKGIELDGAAARVALAGAVAQSYTDLTRATRQIALAAATSDLREKQLALVTTRAKAGLASDLDIAAAQTLLAEARQAGLRAEAHATRMRHALAALAGRGPDYGEALAPPSLDLATALPMPAAIPADLLA